MKRFAGIAALALLVAACSEPTTAPGRSGPTGPFLATGNPPPPPLSGQGSASLLVGDSPFEDFVAGSAIISASVSADEVTPGCAASISIPIFDYDYFINSQNTNAFLHIFPNDPSRLVTIHQHGDLFEASAGRLTVHGVISGGGFSFKITDAIDGAVFDPARESPGDFFVTLEGTLTRPDGSSCQANARLEGTLSGESEEPPPVTEPPIIGD